MKRTTGSISFRSGAFRLRWQSGGTRREITLLNPDGTRCGDAEEAEKARRRVMAIVSEPDIVEQARRLNDALRDAVEDAEAERDAAAKDSLTAGVAWERFATSQYRPKAANEGRVQFGHYRRSIRRFADWAGAARRLCDVSREDAAAFLESLAVSGATRNTIRKALSAVWRTFIREGAPGMDRNPWLENPPEEVEESVKEPMTREQLDAVIAADSRLKGVLLTCWHTGLRLGDAATLDAHEVDLSLSIITRRPRKTAWSSRKKIVVGIPEELAALLRECPREGMVFQWAAKEYLRGHGALAVRITRALKKAGLYRSVPGGAKARPVLGAHSARYAFVTRAAAAGVPFAAVQAAVGHSAASMTEHYTRFTPEEVRRFAAMLEGDPLREEAARLLAAATPEKVRAVIELLTSGSSRQS